MIDMVHNPPKTFADTCMHCDENSSLGQQCCGMCIFEYTCTETQTERLLEKLAAMGIDLSAVTPATFFEAIKGRSVWIVGDSQMKFFYTALECFLGAFTITNERSMPFPGNDGLNYLMRRGDDYNIFW